MGDMADYEGYYEPKDVQEQDQICKHCKKDGLYWKKTNNRWRLIEQNDKPHVCEKYYTNKPKK